MTIKSQFLIFVFQFLMLANIQYVMADELSVLEKETIAYPVDTFHKTLLEIIQYEDFNRRIELLGEVISTQFDAAAIARIVLRPYWLNLEQEQKHEFTEQFERLMIVTYADRFQGLGESVFTPATEIKALGTRFIVKTELLPPEDEAVRFDYIVQQDEPTWKIVGVIVNGINDLALKRAEYKSIVDSKGVDGLILEIKNQTQAIIARNLISE